MKSRLNKLLAMGMVAMLTISVSVVSSPVVSYADENDITSQVEETIDSEKEVVKIESTLGMFTPTESTVKVNKNGTVTVEFTTNPVSRVYNKIALISQESTVEAKEKNAIKSKVNEDNSCTFKFTIPVNQLGKNIPFSTYQTYNGESEWHNWSEQKYLKFNYTVDTTNQLIEAIYVQERDAYTDKLCKAAKASWDALSDSQKEKVEEADYFGLDTGDASKDNALNGDKIGSKELLVVSFGTSFNDSRVATIKAVEDSLAKKFSKYSVRRAFTSQIIINHIQARDGEKIDNVKQALDRAVKNKVSELVVVPTHLMSGAEYDEMKKLIDNYSGKIDVIKYAKPLCDSDSDKENVIKSVTDATAKRAGFESVTQADNKTAFVFMGHGTEHAAQVTYTKLQKALDSKGYKNCFIGTVEGKPAATACESIIERVKKAGYEKVVLRPLMVVAGDHANNDMAGDDEDSWKSMFEAAGMEVSCQINGLGEVKGIQNIYISHASKAIEAAEKATKAVKVTKEKNAIKASTISGIKISATKKKHTINISWSKNSKVTGYKVYRSTSKNGTYKLVKTTSAKSVKLTNNKAKKTYYFKVKGYKKVSGTVVCTKCSKTCKVKAK